MKVPGELEALQGFTARRVSPFRLYEVFEVLELAPGDNLRPQPNPKPKTLYPKP